MNSTDKAQEQISQLSSYQDQPLSQQEWLEIAKSSLSPNKSPLLFFKVASAVKFPSAEIFKKILTIDFLNEAFLRDNQQKYSPREEQRLCRELWKVLVKEYSLSIKDIPSPSNFIFHLLNQGFEDSVRDILKNSDKNDVKNLMMVKTYIDFSSAYDKKNVLQALLSGNYKNIVEEVRSIEPSILTGIDKKNRSVFFAIKNKEMFDYLKSLGIDQSTKNSDNQNALDFWLSEKIYDAATWGFDGGNTKADPIEANVVNKIFSHKNDFNKEEQEAYERISSNPLWVYEGSLYGLERAWTLTDIWSWSKALHFADLLGQPDRGKYYYEAYSNSRNIMSPADFEKKMTEDLSLFPEIEKAVNDPSRPSSMFEKTMAFFTALRSKNQKPDDHSPLPKVQNYNENSVRYNLFVENANFFLEALPTAEKEEFNNIILDVLNTPSFLVNPYQMKIANYAKKLALPDFLGGMCTEVVAKKTYFLPQKEGLRTESFVQEYIKSLVEQKDKISEALKTRPPADFAPVLHCCLPMLGTGFAGSYQYRQKVSALCKEMIDMGVPMKKVYARWTKHYSEDLQAGITKWIILGAVDKKSRKTGKKLLETKEEIQKPRRKM